METNREIMQLLTEIRDELRLARLGFGNTNNQPFPLKKLDPLKIAVELEREGVQLGRVYSAITEMRTQARERRLSAGLPEALPVRNETEPTN